MPHAVISAGTDLQTTTFDGGARQLIPGVAPGGSRVGRSKPALLINDAYIEVGDLDTAAEDYHEVRVYLKLSQEPNLDPGLILLVGTVQYPSAGATNPHAMNVEQLGHKLAGTIWAPKFVGMRHVESGVMQWVIDIHLDYEMIELEWMDWFIHWDFLDNVVNNSRQY